MGYTGAAPTTADLTTLAGDISGTLAVELSPLLSSSYNFDSVSCVDLANPGTAEGINSTVVAGSRTGTPNPLSLCALINFHIGRRYRGSRPKIWLPFGTDTDIASTTSWGTTFVNAVNTDWGNFITNLGGTVFGGATLGSQVAVSYFGPPTIVNTGRGRNRYSSTPRTTPLVEPVLSHSCRSVFGSQRRRL
jgi:hypothetical protein